MIIPVCDLAPVFRARFRIVEEQFRAFRKERLFDDYAEELPETDFIMIVVGITSRPDGSADTGYVEDLQMLGLRCDVGWPIGHGGVLPLASPAKQSFH